MTHGSAVVGPRRLGEDQPLFLYELRVAVRAAEDGDPTDTWRDIFRLSEVFGARSVRR